MTPSSKNEVNGGIKRTAGCLLFVCSQILRSDGGEILSKGCLQDSCFPLI